MRWRPGETLAEAMARFERALIEEALASAGPTAAARRLGLTREGLYRARKRLGLLGRKRKRSRVLG